MIRSLLNVLPGKSKQRITEATSAPVSIESKIHSHQPVLHQKLNSSFFITFSKDIHDFLLHHAPQTRLDSHQKTKPLIRWPFPAYWILGGVLVVLLSALFFFRPAPALQNGPRNLVLRTIPIQTVQVEYEIAALPGNSVNEWKVLPGDTIWGYFEKLVLSTDPADQTLAAGGWENFQNMIRMGNPALTDLNTILPGDTIIISSSGP